MRTEEVLLQLIFSNQMLFCGIFGALGGVVHSLDISSHISLPAVLSKIIISSAAGMLLFFSTYDIAIMTPSLRIAAAIVSGFYGSALFRYLAKFYLKQGLAVAIVDKPEKEKEFDPLKEFAAEHHDNPKAKHIKPRLKAKQNGDLTDVDNKP